MNFKVKLTKEECNAVLDTFRADLDELCLEENISFAYAHIILRFDPTKNLFCFSIDDTTAHEIIQNMLVYADRILSNEDYSVRSGSLIRFATQMLTAYTGKTENDY